jgi:hypothetical protein
MAGTDLEDGGLMKLGLSSAAAIGAGIGDLVEICRVRGLSGIELRLHDLDAAGVLASARDGIVMIAGCYSETSSDAAQLASISRRLHAPIIVADECSIDTRIRRARAIDGAGGRALVLARGDADNWFPAISQAGVDYAWEIDPAATDITAEIDTILHTPPYALRYIRFIGGGPEATMHDGRGIGALMSRLALAAYDGAVILTPSSPRYRVAWSTWLGRRGGWGCGSKAAPATGTLPLHTATGDVQ